MTLVIELTDEQEAKLRRAAGQLGLKADEYARLMVERMTEQDQEEVWEADLDALTEGHEHLPVLPTEATARHSVYGDRG